MKLGEERVLLGGGELVAAGVGDDGHAAGTGDPAHRVAQARPAVRHEARLACGEVAAEHLGGVAADAGFHQPAREMGARHQVGVAHVGERALEGTLDAHLGQRVGHLLRAPHAPAADVGQARLQVDVVRVHAEADDVHGFARKAHRHLHPRQVVDAQGLGGGGGAVLAAEFVVVGQGPELHAAIEGALGQGFGFEGAVGDGGVAVEVGVEQVHDRIVGSGPWLRRRGGFGPDSGQQAQHPSVGVVGEQVEEAVGPLPHVADAFVQALQQPLLTHHLAPVEFQPHQHFATQRAEEQAALPAGGSARW